MRNSKNTFPVSSDRQLLEKQNAWKKATKSTLRELNNLSVTNQIPKDIFKTLLKAMSDCNEQKLCELLLKGYEREFKDFHSKAVWKSNYSIKFPQ